MNKPNKLSGAQRRKIKKKNDKRQNVLVSKVRKLDTFFEKITESTSSDLLTNSGSVNANEDKCYDQSGIFVVQTDNIPKNEETSLTVLKDPLLGKAEEGTMTIEKAVEKNEERKEENVNEKHDNGSCSVEFVDYSDPAKWDINEQTISMLVEKNPKQDINNLDFSNSKIVYDRQNRFASKGMFFRKLVN